jgi:hypothetical protein
MIHHPLNTVAILSDLELMQRAFGEAVLLAILEQRINLARRYAWSVNLQENIHTVDLLTAGYEPASINWHYFAANGRQLVEFYLDEQIICTAYAFKPQIRFCNGVTTKPLLKQILAQHEYGAVANKLKGMTTFKKDLFAWFRNGPLADRARAIQRPNFLSQQDFDRLLDHPSHFLWSLFAWDIFETNVLSRFRKRDLAFVTA